MKSAIFFLMILVPVGTLLADNLDPGVSLTSGGKHSDDVNCPTSRSSVTFTSFSNEPIENGGVGFDIVNPCAQDIVAIAFLIPTNNFDQIFTAESNLFLDAQIYLDPHSVDIPGMGAIPLSLDIPSLTIVVFDGTGNGSNAMATAGPLDIPCLPRGSASCPAGFADGGIVSAFAEFGTGTGDHSGLGAGDEAVLGVNVPEPATFLLLFSAAGLLLGCRKLYSRQTKGRL